MLKDVGREEANDENNGNTPFTLQTYIVILNIKVVTISLHPVAKVI